MQTDTTRPTGSARTREIPKDEWPRFFDDFSRRYQGWLVTIEILGALGAQVEAEERTLNGVVAEERDGSSVIEILTGPSPGKTLTHTIARPARVQIDEIREGADVAMLIESPDEGRTLIRFRSPDRKALEPGH